MCVCGGGGGYWFSFFGLIKDTKTLSAGYICSCGKCEVEYKYKVE